MGLSEIIEVSVERLDSYRSSRSLSVTTSQKELQTLRQFFDFCKERKWIADNPARKIKTPTNAKPQPVVPYTSKEVGQIIGACNLVGRSNYERFRARAMVLLLRYTGLRISDVATLARDRVRDGEILVHTVKTGGTVKLPVPPELEAALSSLPAPRGADEGQQYFFWNGNTSQRAVIGIAERTLSAVFKKSGVRNAHAHRFRHTLATDILTKGGTEQDVADVLGISANVVRKHYAKWTQARQDRVTNLMHVVHSGTFLAQTGKGAVIH